jgi:hypothetical protein
VYVADVADVAVVVVAIVVVDAAFVVVVVAVVADLYVAALVGCATYVDANVDAIVCDVVVSGVFTLAAKPNVTED